MCGLTGGWSRQRFDDLKDALPGMTGALVHRGPDDDGQWFDPEAGIALGHRRLAIVDLSPAGHQPMASATGRWVIAYNGEIYNHQDLRVALEASGKAPPWRGHSDTETLLAAIEAWGVPAALERSAGMFAFALWDRDERTLWLARDRFGEKPLYYGWNRGVFLFGSELKALQAFPGFSAVVDRQALALYLRHNAIPAPYSIHQGIRKLLPGHWLRLTVTDLQQAGAENHRRMRRHLGTNAQPAVQAVGDHDADQQQGQPSQQQLGGYPQKVLRAAQVVDHDGISLELEGGIPLRLILTEPMP